MDPNEIMDNEDLELDDDDLDEDLDDDLDDDDLDDDDLPEEIEEEDLDEPAESIDDFLNEGTDKKKQQSSQPQQKGKQGTSEPGYVQGRIQKAVKQALAAERDTIKAEVRAEMEAEYKPIKDRMLEMDAQELVRTGEFKSVERAKEYLLLKQGKTPAPEQQPKQANDQPRNEKGQFAPKEDPVKTARNQILRKQAAKIKASTGIDVVEECTDPDLRQKILSGEADMYDALDFVRSQKSKRKRPPAPARSSNGASRSNTNAIADMSDEALERMDRKLEEGARYRLG